MAPDEVKLAEGKIASVLPENIRKEIAQAIKEDIEVGREPKGSVSVDNPDCIAYLCQCASSSYCCVCLGTTCAAECQNGCYTFQCFSCTGVAGNTCDCLTDSDCPGACADSPSCVCDE